MPESNVKNQPLGQVWHKKRGNYDIGKNAQIFIVEN